MKYKVTHPFSGVATVFDSLDEAENYKQQIILEEVAKIDSNRLLPHIAQEIEIAKQFVKETHNFDCELKYYHSVWNVDTQSRLSVFYHMVKGNEDWEIKVSNGKVTEQYRTCFIDGTMILEANDLVTKEKIEYYKFVDKNLNILPNANPLTTFNIHGAAKYDLNNNFITLNEWGYFNSLPLEKQNALKNFEYKDTIFEHKQQTYGFIVHYLEKVYYPSTLEEQADWINKLNLQVQEIPDEQN